jgi:UPF0755 protein
MSSSRHDKPRPRLSMRSMPRSPSEALEPTRAPARPRGTRRRREARRLGPVLRAVNGLLSLAVVVLGVIGGAAVWFDHELDKEGPTEAVRGFVVREREGARDIAQRLEADGIINSQHLFVAHYVARSFWTWFGGKPLVLKAGDYQIERGQSMREIAELIGEGKSVLLAITAPEGLTSHQIAERLRADPNLTGEITAVPPEGSLLPDTYKYPRGISRQALIELMQKEARRFLEKAWETRQANLPFRSPEEALILASIVEKETGRKDERDRVAAVFVNRLRQGMRLQSDPTILYGLSGGQVAWGRPILKSDIQSRTAHNTYQIDGMPPTPICNPGRAAIAAVLNPAKTGDLYFVADGNGGHVFSQTLKDHNAAVANWRKVEQDLRARQAEAAAKTGQKQAAPQPTEEASEDTSSPAGGAAPAARAPVAAASNVPLPTRKPKK